MSGEKPIYVLSMGNPATDYYSIFFFYRNAYPVLAYADFVFVRITLHLLKISEVKGIFTDEFLENYLLCLRSDFCREFKEFFQEMLFIFNSPHLFSRTDKRPLLHGWIVAYHQILHP